MISYICDANKSIRLIAVTSDSNLYVSGPTSYRPNDSTPRLYYDTSLGKIILGHSGTWYDIDGNIV